MKKTIVGVLSTLLLLSGCGTASLDSAESKKVASGASEQEQAESSLVAFLEKDKQSEEFKYMFTIVNSGNQTDVLKYTSMQDFDYTIKDDAGSVVYVYSMDKLFIQQVSEKSLKPGELLEVDIDLTADLKNLKPGKYQLEVWSTAVERPNLRNLVEFQWDGGVSEEGTKLMGATVTYVGLQDSNSIEVINAAGEFEHFRLSEKVKPFFDTLDTKTKISIQFSILDEQKVIEEVGLQ